MMTTVVLKTINEQSKDGKTCGMWILQYIVDGKSVAVKVVTGEKKTKENGDIWYVAKGMGIKDFATLKPVYAEFAALSAKPPEPPAPVANADEIEEVPF